MNKEKEFHKRKELRIKQYDYSSAGAYFITICVKDRQPILSDIVKPSVGVGALDDPHTRLTRAGEIAERNLLSSENISGVIIDKYVIMPDHLHAIVILYPSEYTNRKNGSSKAPTPTNEMLPHIVATFKRFCTKEIGNNIFQRGYMEHIIRNREDYETKAKYICNNPTQWYYNKNT